MESKINKIKEGDFVIDTKSPSKIPHIVIKYSEENNTLGYFGKGWFSWIPISKRHKKVNYESNKKNTQKIKQSNIETSLFKTH